MSSFWARIKTGLVRFMAGRNGTDQLCVFTLWAGLLCSLLDGFLGTGILFVLGTALYILTIFRMFSRNTAKRAAENTRFMNGWERLKRTIRQLFLRLKNSREYKYFRCPQCKALLRLSRGCGEKEITCPKCGHAFKQKA